MSYQIRARSKALLFSHLLPFHLVFCILWSRACSYGYDTRFGSCFIIIWYSQEELQLFFTVMWAGWFFPLQFRIYTRDLIGVITVSFEEEKECYDRRETSAPCSLYILFVSSSCSSCHQTIAFSNRLPYFLSEEDQTEIDAEDEIDQEDLLAAADKDANMLSHGTVKLEEETNEE